MSHLSPYVAPLIPPSVLLDFLSKKMNKEAKQIRQKTKIIKNEAVLLQLQTNVLKQGIAQFS
jgi:hypothetical protein